MPETEKPHEVPWMRKATFAISALALLGAGINTCYVFLAHKEYAEASKARAETDLLLMKGLPRAEVGATDIAPDSKPFGERDEFCIIGGRYTLKNVGEAPIRISSLHVNVYEVPLGEAPAENKKVTPISFNTRIHVEPISHEELPESSGLVQSGEMYSRSYGYIVRRDPSKQYAIEASPQPANSNGFEPNVFRAWSNLTGICNLPRTAGGQTPIPSASAGSGPKK